MKSQVFKTADLPDCPGVYYFLGPNPEGKSSTSNGAGKQILYIGKATSLRDRVRSYFNSDLLLTRGEKLVKFLDQTVAIDFRTTDSVLEAIILEAHEIQKHSPVGNTIGKDNKSFNYVIITEEEFPRIIVRRGRELNFGSPAKVLATAGPFPHGGELREALKIIRRIFPYRDEKCKLTGKPCFNAQIGLCPGPCAGWISKAEYRKRVRYIIKFFEGRKVELVKDIEREMKKAAKEQKFEEAEKLKRTLYALEHIQDMALIKRDIERVHGKDTVRIEAYDIAHISGKDVVGVMTVVEDGELNKSQYRKFRVRNQRNDDVNNLKEVLSRRLNHPEWDMPQVVVVDGGVAQLNAAKELLKDTGIEVVSVVKDDKHKAKQIIGGDKTIESWSKSILLANAEAHRFAIGYHRKLRGKGFRI